MAKKSLQDPDRVFAEVLSLFDGQEPAAARETAAKLILLLADAVGDDDAILSAVKAARAPQAERGEFIHYGYFRSSADFRVRIALALKDLEFPRAFVHLRRGEQHGGAYRKLNPQSLVPLLRRIKKRRNAATARGGESLGQSLAIIEYLDALYPQPELLPGDEWNKAQIRAFALAIACDIHPLQNLRTLRRLQSECNTSAAVAENWARKWMEDGLRALEAQAAARMRRYKSEYIFGARPTLAEVALIPQIYNARRFNCDLGKCPTLNKIYDNCMQQRAFQKAAPESQPDCDI